MASQDEPPDYHVREELTFRQDREALVAEGVSEQEIDTHLWAIQDSILPHPQMAPWSQPIPDDPDGARIAVSDATPAEPNAVRIVYTVEDALIRLWRIERRL